MTEAKHTHMKPTEGRVADAVYNNWVDLHAPAWARPYLRLSRMDRPAGTWLLLIPCLWAVGLALAETGGWSAHGVWIIVGCAAGAFLMRGAGCTWNDMADVKFDAGVARTRSRPLPSGQTTRSKALVWLIAQCLLAFGILLTFPPIAIALGIAALGPVALYPFAKRFTWWPQVFLGLAFNWGALLAYAAITGTVSLPSVLLYLTGIAWTLFYDTIYAHQDIEDDALIGVKSTARLFGHHTPAWLRRFLIVATTLAGMAVISALIALPNPLPLAVAIAGVWGFGAHLAWQMRRLELDDPARCMHLFRSNRDAGLILAGSLLLAASLA